MVLDVLKDYCSFIFRAQQYKNCLILKMKAK